MILYHVLAILIVVIWGTTFVSTKVLIMAGMTPAVIFTIRFIIAYMLMFAIAPKPLWSKSLKHELVMLALGMTGGSLYFLAENMSLLFTTATNASLIVCSCPLFAALFFWLFMKEKMTAGQWKGTLMAFVGMAIVVMNGQFVLQLNPLGDTLALTACIMWAVYSLLIKKIGGCYSSKFITRKVFFYGVITMVPYFMVRSAEIPSDWSFVEKTEVWGNLLFLSVVASFACFLLWTVCMNRLGAVETTNYVYLNPLATIVVAWLVLDEVVTLWFVIGSILILFGLWQLMKNQIKG